MSRFPRINIKLVVAAVCIIAGLVILWRTFGAQQPAQVAVEPTSIATPQPTRRANAELTGVTPPPALPTLAAYPIEQTTPSQEPPPSPTAIVPTAVVPTAAFEPSPSPSIAISPSPEVATTLAPSPTPLPSATSSPATSQPATPAPTATPQPTASVATNTPAPTSSVDSTATSSPTPTLAPTAVQPTPSVITVTYIVTGAVSRALVGYADATGKIIDLPNASLPWSITFQADPNADLYIDVVAIPDNEQDVVISCAIQINGSNVFYGKQLPFDQDTSANGGVTCDRTF